MVTSDDIVEAIEETVRNSLNELVETGSLECDVKIRVRATLVMEVLDNE